MLSREGAEEPRGRTPRCWVHQLGQGFLYPVLSFIPQESPGLGKIMLKRFWRSWGVGAARGGILGSLSWEEVSRRGPQLPTAIRGMSASSWQQDLGLMSGGPQSGVPIGLSLGADIPFVGPFPSSCPQGSVVSHLPQPGHG